jgi:hypothetical protein
LAFASRACSADVSSRATTSPAFTGSPSCFFTSSTGPSARTEIAFDSLDVITATQSMP